MHRLTVLIVALLSVAACATKPIAADIAVPGQVMAFQQPPTGAYGSITVVRDAGFLAGGCAIEVSVEGKPAAVLERGQKAVLYLPTGGQILGASFTGKGMCGAETNNDRTRSDLEIHIEAGDIRSYRIAMSPDAGLDIMPAPVR